MEVAYGKQGDFAKIPEGEGDAQMRVIPGYSRRQSR